MDDVKRKLIVHIGQLKTGSTSIQKMLAAARPRLEAMDVIYPLTNLIAHNHRALGPAIFGVTEGGLRIQMGGNPQDVLRSSDEEWAYVVQQCQKSKANTIIISSEHFFGDLTGTPGKRLRTRLRSLSIDPRVVGYIRSPTSYYLSLVQQQLKAGFGIVPPTPLHWHKTINSYHDALGVELETRVFERSRLLDGDVVTDFMHWIGYPELGTARPSEPLNTSVSAEAMSVLSRLGPAKYPRDKRELARHMRLTRAVKQQDRLIPNPTLPRLRPEVAEHITRINGDLVLLRDELGLIFNDIDYGMAGKVTSSSTTQFDALERICPFDVERRDILENMVRQEPGPGSNAFGEPLRSAVRGLARRFTGKRASGIL